MLSRREKLLVQPWEDRRFKDHRQKVERARAAVDAVAPSARPHVAVKLKRRQRERERRDKLTADNFALLQRLARLMSTTRLDNRWKRPLPNFHQKVGVFYEPDVLRRRVEARARLPSVPRLAGGKCYACEFRKMKNNTYGTIEDELKLPSI
ncbi:uncharacterized protein LOC123669658 [Melitaea cinxia]|uniref:uncharacterized protein LOC123669658 n=1 Tax=Melitaea cinxia TaxID=113334 RepID=UPI001E270C84|nr:uncharacterized protein LOC123669658 [Melitaea cinxia]